MDYYEFLPDQLKAMLDDISDEEAEAARKEEKTVAQSFLSNMPSDARQ